MTPNSRSRYSASTVTSRTPAFLDSFGRGRSDLIRTLPSPAHPAAVRKPETAWYASRPGKARRTAKPEQTNERTFASVRHLATHRKPTERNQP